MDTNSKQIGKNLAKIRKNAGITQIEVSKALDISRPSISLLEKGKRDLSANELVKLADFFKVEMKELVLPKTEHVVKATGSKKGMVKIIFLRHGEAMDDIYNQYGGWANPDLSAKGINKAFGVAQKLKRDRIRTEIIYTSPLKRARTKAEILAREMEAEVKTLLFLKERNTYGLLCGISKEIAKRKYPDLVNSYEQGKYVLGSESYEDFVDRLKYLFDFLKKCKKNEVICVSHGKLISAIIKEFLKMEIDRLGEGCMLTVGIDDKGLFYIESEGIIFKRVSDLKNKK